MLVQRAVRHVAKCHPLDPFTGHIDLALVHARGGADVGVHRVGHGQPVHDVPVLVRTGLERLGCVGPDSLLVLGHVVGLGSEVALHLHGFGIRGLQAKSDPPVGGYFRRHGAAALAQSRAQMTKKDDQNGSIRKQCDTPHALLLSNFLGPGVSVSTWTTMLVE